MTSAKGMFALAGVALAISEGNELVKDDNISDPSGQIAENLAEQLTGKYGMNYAGKTNGTVDGDSPVDISQVANGNAYAIDVETTGWSYMYDGFNFSDYFVTYTAEMKLVDLASSSTVAKGRCLYSSKDVNGTVPEEKLTKNNSAYIKEQLAGAVVRCSDEFGKKVLNL